MKNKHSVLYILLALGTGALFLTSCKANEADISLWEEAETEVSETSVYFKEGQDIILSSYRDPKLREKVLDFFEDLADSREVASVILANASVIEVAPALAFALCAEESGYNPQAFNRNKNNTIDRGLFQLNSASFPELKVTDFYDSGKNAWHGLSHLRWCLNTAGSEVAGLAMYNAGMTRVRSGGTPKHTLDYVSRIINRERKIEELFLAEYAIITHIEIAEQPKKPPFRLNLLTPLGGR